MPECYSSKLLQEINGNLWREWEGRCIIYGKCCFKHHKKSLEAAASKAKGRVPCHNNGLTPKIDSLAVMIDWLTTSSNYNRWHGGDKQNGAAKSVIENESQFIKDKGITVYRTGRDIQKVKHLEKQIRATKYWVNLTGAGLTFEESVKAAVKHRCPYNYELADFMSDIPSSMPLSTLSSINNFKILMTKSQMKLTTINQFKLTLLDGKGIQKGYQLWRKSCDNLWVAYLLTYLNCHS